MGEETGTLRASGGQPTYTFGENDDQVLIAGDTPISTRQQPIPVPDIELPDDGETLSDTVIRLRGDERN